jgi:uncharacterized protein involved in exopolysaccharide biosynthesis
MAVHTSPSGRPGKEVEISARGLLGILFRQKGKILLFFMLTVAAVTMVTLVLPEIYQAEAKLMIKIGRESLAVDPGVEGETVPLSQSRQNEIFSEISILKSRYVIETAVEKIGPERFFDRADGPDKVQQASVKTVGAPFPPLEALLRFLEPGQGAPAPPEPAVSGPDDLRSRAADIVAKGLSVENERNSHILRLTFPSPEPLLARSVLEAVIDAYLAHHIKVHQSQTPSRFFWEQAQGANQALNETEEELRRFRVRNGIGDFDRQKLLLVDRIGELERDLHAAAVQRKASGARIASLERSRNQSPAVVEISRVSGKANPAIHQIKTRLVDLRLKEADLAARYADGHRTLIDVRNQIRLAEAALAGEAGNDIEVMRGINVNRQTLELDLVNERSVMDAQTARERELRSELREAREQMDAFLSHEGVLTGLKRDIEISREKYLKYMEKFQQASISEKLDTGRISNVSLVQPPSVGRNPVKPKKTLNIALGLVLGLFGGVALGFAWDYFDDAIKTREDVEKLLEIPVLVSVSREEFKTCI